MILMEKLQPALELGKVSLIDERNAGADPFEPLAAGVREGDSADAVIEKLLDQRFPIE